MKKYSLISIMFLFVICSVYGKDPYTKAHNKKQIGLDIGLSIGANIGLGIRRLGVLSATAFGVSIPVYLKCIMVCTIMPV